MNESYSVLIPVYSKETVPRLITSIDSMLNQTILPEQIVIVGDGELSRELNTAIIDLQKRFPSIFTVVGYPENKGLAYALNVGLEACRNELVARMDSDDYSMPNRCERQLAAFDRNPSLVLVGGNMGYFEESPANPIDKVRRYPTDLKIIKKTLKRNSPFAHPVVMFKKSAVLEAGGYHTELRRRQDYELFSRMIVHCGMHATNVDEVLLLFRADESFYFRNRTPQTWKQKLIAQRMIFMRGDCSLFDFLYVCAYATASMLLPEKLYNAIYSKIVRS